MSTETIRATTPDNRQTGPGRAIYDRFRFEQALEDVVMEATAQYANAVRPMAEAEMRRFFTLTAAGDPAPFEPGQLAAAWDASIAKAIEVGFERLISVLPTRLGTIMRELYSVGRFLTLLDDTMSDWLYNAVLDMFGTAHAEGLHIRRIEQALDKVFAITALADDTQPPGLQTRAQRLARTAATSSYNRAMLEQIRADGFTLKLWVAHHDSRTRDTHAHADGTAIPLDNPFRVGDGFLSYPGDPTGPIGETINCRCVLVGENGEPTQGIDWSQPVIPLSDRLAQGLTTIAEAQEQGFLTPAQAARLLEESLAASGGPDQARAPKGTPIGGQWIDTPGAMLKELLTAYRKPVFEQDLDRNERVMADLADALETYYVFGAETVAAKVHGEGPDSVHLNRTYGETGFTVEVDVQRYGTGYIVAEGVVYSQFGQEAGVFRRKFEADPYTDQVIVHHEYLKMNPEYRGQGFGTDFSYASEEMYRDLGVEAIKLHAALEDGGLTWARAGYQLDTEVSSYIDFNHQVIGEFENTIGEYEMKGDEGVIDVLMGLSMSEAYSGSVDLDASGYTIDDLLALRDADGFAVGEELLRGSSWYGVKYLQPESMAAAGATGAWAQSPERDALLWDFCYSRGVDYTSGVWPQEDARAWREIDDAGRAAWNSLTAAGFNPAQVRAPKDTPIGGQWVDSPSGLLMRLTPGGPRRAYINPTYAPSEELLGLSEKYKRPLINVTRRALQEARNSGVYVSMPHGALRDVLIDGRMKNLHELEGSDLERATLKTTVTSEKYTAEHKGYLGEVLGVPENTPTGDLPIYGWGHRSSPEATVVFGDATLRLKDSVVERTSWTIGDSMMDEVPPIMSGDIDNATDEMLLAASGWNAGLALQETETTQGDFRWAVNYVEAQVHGGVTLDDIAAVVVRPTGSGEVDPDIKAMLDQHGIPVEKGWGPTRYVPTGRGPGTKGPAGGDWDLRALSETFAWNPTQARAPRGTPIGGQWVPTPRALYNLIDSVQTRGYAAGQRFDSPMEWIKSERKGMARDHGILKHDEAERVRYSMTDDLFNERINEYLRDGGVVEPGDPDSPSFYSDSDSAILSEEGVIPEGDSATMASIRALDTHLSYNTLDAPVRLFRGVSTEDVSDWKPGMQVRESGYSSTTYENSVAHEFANFRSGKPSAFDLSNPNTRDDERSGEPLVMSIVVAPGTHYYHGVGSIGEVVLERDMVYQVVEQLGSTVTVMAYPARMATEAMEVAA